MKALLAITITLSACSGGDSRTLSYAVGAREYLPAPAACTIKDNTAGAIVALPDHYKAKDGKGLVFEAVKPGRAKIDCGDSNGATIDVREAVKVEMRNTDRRNQAVKVGSYAPHFCLVAFDKDGKQLELGDYVEGTKLMWISDHAHRVTDHGMAGGGSASCLDEGMARKPGTGTVTGSWHGFSSNATFEVIP